MSSLYAWLHMGGYYFYVWLAYGVVVGGLGLHCTGLIVQKRHAKQRLRDWFKRAAVTGTQTKK